MEPIVEEEEDDPNRHAWNTNQTEPGVEVMSDTPSDDELTTGNDEHDVSFQTTVGDDDYDFLQGDAK